MRLGPLLTLDAFVRLRGTGEAAQGLGVSQSAVIKTLKHAEEELDLSLAVTIQGRLVPTPEALALVQRAQPLFATLRRARHEADMIRVGMADRLRVATVPGLAHSILPPAIAQTRRSLSEAVAVEIMFDHVREHLAAGEVDLGLSYGPMQTPDIEDLPLGESPLVCVLAGGHPLARRRELTRADLEGERLVSYAPDGVSSADSFQSALIGAGLAGQIAITVRHTDTACHLVREGVGLAVVDGFVISSNLVEGLLTLPLEQSPPVTAYAHQRRGSALGRPARLLLDELQGRRMP
ncbi:DNA-binding transcriptional regulator, LysR family [Bosea sp. OK403]|uniref:LysR family transcriptional regulator n=1 Tax=Bosea sp. OK403 TaxID=1855286 RepID=UPI0008ECE4A3|nr:LysR family transcriptional regulator [Bosea sp. OK403]SFJ70573.1 DNA-binding transcriptional regulator, LysR family [Bosea sp. OK403]